MKNVKLWIALALSAFTLNAGAQNAGQSTRAAAEEVVERVRDGRPSIGLRLGVAEASGNFSGGLDYGVEAGAQMFDQISLAGELSGTTVDRDGDKPGLTRTKLLAKALYNFAGDIPVIRHSYAGAGIGPVYDNVGNDQKWNLGLSPQVGFDIPLTAATDSRITLGANVAMLFVTGGTPEMFSANALAKYWF